MSDGVRSIRVSVEHWSEASLLQQRATKGPITMKQSARWRELAQAARVSREFNNFLFPACMLKYHSSDDPTIPFGQWQLNNPCPIPRDSTPPDSACNYTSFPQYVVNATTVKHIQAAVNFARNNNIRLTIKYGPVSKAQFEILNFTEIPVMTFSVGILEVVPSKSGYTH